MKQFGRSRRSSRLQGAASKKQAAVIKYTPATPHETAIRAAQPWPVTQPSVEAAPVDCLLQEKSARSKARLNSRAYPELSVMHALSKGRLPSKRLRFHFPDLFPEVKEVEKAASSRIYYQEPPKLVNTESLLRWMVPSVPWRYLQGRYSPSPLILPKETQTELGTPDETPREADSVPKRQPSATCKDAGCQTVRDQGVQTSEMPLHPSQTLDTVQRQVVALERGCFNQERKWIDAAVQTEARRRPRNVVTRSQKSPRVKKPRSRPSRGPRREEAVEDAVRSTLVPDDSIVELDVQPPQSDLDAALARFPAEASIGREDVQALGVAEPELGPRRLALQPTAIPSNSDLIQTEAKEDTQSPVVITAASTAAPTGCPSKKAAPKESIHTGAERQRHQESRKEKKHSTAKGTSYLLKMSVNDPKEEEKGAETSSASMDTRTASLKSIESASVGSSMGSLEELERLIETQHAQLVAKGFLPPDTELARALVETDDDSSNNATTSNSHPKEEGAEELPAVDSNEGGLSVDGRVQEGGSSGSTAGMSSESGLYDASLSKLMESLGMSTTDVPATQPPYPSEDSSELERSAAAIAALTSYQSQLSASVADDDVIYEVSISKDSD